MLNNNSQIMWKRKSIAYKNRFPMLCLELLNPAGDVDTVA